MLNTIFTTQFKKDYKLMQKRGAQMQNLVAVMEQLKQEQPLAPNFRDHALTGNYKGYRECHIAPDWLLIYRVEQLDLYLVRTGSHSDLF